MTNSWRCVHLTLSQFLVRRAAIGRVGLLGDDPFLARRAHRVEQLLALAEDMVGIEDEGGAPVAEQGGEALLALDIGQAGQVLAVDLERVEQEQGEAAAALADRLLERREAGIALVVERDDLAVEQGACRTRIAPAASAISGNLSVQSSPVRV